MRVERYIRIPVQAAFGTADCPSKSRTRSFRRKLSGFFVFVAVFLLLWAVDAEAATYGYEAQEMIRSAQVVELAPGQIADFTMSFKNTGSSVWRTDGDRFVSVYTYGPKYRQSAFRDVSWYKDVQPAKIGGEVHPGQLGMFRFRLRAPSQEGTYSETFHLAAEDLAWIPGGEFTVQIRVSRSAPVASSITTASSSSVSTGSYSAQEVYRSPKEINMAPGEIVTLTMGFRNTGSATWYPSARNYVSVYTYDPKYRKSDFEDVSWYRYNQPARISTQVTPPGQMGEVKMRLKAPTTPGVYRETFHLAAEDLTWIPGGKFTVVINVSGPSTTSSAPSPASALLSNLPAGGYAAVRMASNTDRPTLDPGQVQELRIAFKNVGTLPWVKYGNEPVRLMALEGNAYSFRDVSWNSNMASAMLQDRIDSGQLAFFNLKMKAPQYGGTYLARFALYAGDRPIEGGTVDIPIEVKQGSVPANVSTNTTNEFAASGDRGPNIVVGLLTTTAPVTVSSTETYQLVDGRNHQPVKRLSGVTTVTFDFSTLVYTVRNGTYTYTSNYHVHLRPDDMRNNIFEISSYENRAAWDRSVNFNKFRGDLAVHYMRSTGRLWVLEELPMEDYIRGLAETSNGSHFEYQKALVSAARTYALFVLSIGGKHKSEYHDVNTTAGDQVYKGYVSELVRPNVVRAVEETRGSMVTYNNELVVTPYFSRSDGRTRAWTEVWGGSHKPWLVSVPAPYDQGRTLWGHGVGMSALDALGRAKDGASWTQILQHYYTGTQIQRAY
ncbi:MAG: NBR1-Ig-like domain-containing protein [Patescibacteria group bacterium]|nr:NBR1-Ig-like domain-containing protein [Patescibacteria group bacterium]